jgi:hypothetical protein
MGKGWSAGMGMVGRAAVGKGWGWSVGLAVVGGGVVGGEEVPRVGEEGVVGGRAAAVAGSLEVVEVPQARDLHSSTA